MNAYMGEGSRAHVGGSFGGFVGGGVLGQHKRYGELVGMLEHVGGVLVLLRGSWETL
jgi:hypothetical protein